MDAEQTAWLAGLLEGEGCFFVQRSSYRIKSGDLVVREYPAIQVAMVDRDIVERVAEVFREFNPSGRCSVSETRMKNPEHQSAHTATIQGWPAVDIMRLVRPYMGVRRGARIDELVASYGKDRLRRVAGLRRAA